MVMIRVAFLQGNKLQVLDGRQQQQIVLFSSTISLIIYANNTSSKDIETTEESFPMSIVSVWQ